MTVLPTCLLLLAAAALVPVPLVHASAGDRSVVFQQCVSQLEQRLCVSPPRPKPSLLGDLGRLPGKLVGIVTYWRCPDTARYECMHAITDRLLADRKPVQQYYGKWPFWRVGGMQEPASVLFSVLNGYAHWRGAQEMRRRIPDGHPLKGYYLTSAYVSMNAWIWSAVFHTRGMSSPTPLYYHLHDFCPHSRLCSQTSASPRNSITSPPQPRSSTHSMPPSSGSFTSTHLLVHSPPCPHPSTLTPRTCWAIPGSSYGPSSAC
jgi:hypothetical protein